MEGGVKLVSASEKKIMIENSLKIFHNSKIKKTRHFKSG
jgi:hypothetical protein